MPSNRSIRSGARALRDLVARAHLRAELLPRLPFVVAIVVAAVALVVAIERDPPNEATAAVDELPSDPPTFYEGGEDFEEAELEILEYGFSKITDMDGRERMLAAVIVRNPHDAELVPGGLMIHTETEEGYPDRLDDLHLGWMPPESTAWVGYVVYANVEGIDPADLKLQASEPSMIYPNLEWETDTGPEYMPDPLTEVEFVGTEPLASPDGHRVHYRTESVAASPDLRFSVLFRDDEGRLLGGLPVSPDPMLDEGYYGAYQVVPEGESFHHFDVYESWVPEGTDLDRIEVGPSR